MAGLPIDFETAPLYTVPSIRELNSSLCRQHEVAGLSSPWWPTKRLLNLVSSPRVIVQYRCTLTTHGDLGIGGIR